MIAIYLPLDLAEELLRRASDLPDVVQQIEAQRILEGLLPTNARPVLALWYPDAQHSEQIYDATLAHALWIAYRQLTGPASDRARSYSRKSHPDTPDPGESSPASRHHS